MSKNSEYVSAMQARMRQFDKDVAALSAEAGAKARAAYDEQVRELRASRDAAQATFLRLQAATDSAGAKMHADMQAHWDTMEAALKKASADLRKMAS